VAWVCPESQFVVGDGEERSGTEVEQVVDDFWKRGLIQVDRYDLSDTTC
jgi:hypothetical protein